MEREQLTTTVTAAQNGDRAALNLLFHTYYNDVYYFALKTLKDEELACDITQDTFVEIINTLCDLKEPAAFVTWMRQVTYHQCTRHFKKKTEVLVEEDEEGNSIFDTIVEERAEFIPGEGVDKEDFRATILALLDTLSEEQRAAVLMHYYHEMSVKDIAQVQQVSEGTVKSRLNYARKALKKSVEDYEKKNGVRLHCSGVLPLLLWLFASARKETMPAAAVKTVAGGVAAATGTSVAATAATGAVIGVTAKTAVGAGVVAKLVALPILTKVIAGVVAASLVMGCVVAGVGDGEKEPNQTEGTSNEGVTDPTGTTGGNDNDVTDPTNPSGTGTEPVGTPDNPDQPDNPLKPDDYTEPTEPEGPTEPETPSESPEVDYEDVPPVTVPVEPDPEPDDNEEDLVTPPGPDTDPDDKPVSDDQFGGVTPQNITYEDWKEWDRATRQAFCDKYLTGDCPPEDYHNILKASAYKGYECGFEGHICRDQGEHEARLKAMAEGCPYCGKNDCVSFFVLNTADLYHDIDHDYCPEYDPHKDPTAYCQDCGLPKWNYGKSGEMCCSKSLSGAYPCSHCGADMGAMKCHHCVKP